MRNKGVFRQDFQGSADKSENTGSGNGQSTIQSAEACLLRLVVLAAKKLIILPQVSPNCAEGSSVFQQQEHLQGLLQLCDNSLDDEGCLAASGGCRRPAMDFVNGNGKINRATRISL